MSTGIVTAETAAPPQTTRPDDPPTWLDPLTPREVVAELNKYIIGQSEAKKAVAIALRNRWRRQQVEEELREEILPNNLIMIGPTGVGKTEIARRLSRLTGSPFIKVEASKFTEVGYVGRDVESMIRDLADTAVAMVRSAREEEVEAEAERQVEERLLDLLLPDSAGPVKPAAPHGSAGPQAPPTPGGVSGSPGNVFVAGPAVSGRTGQPGDPNGDATLAERRARTREKLRKLLVDGHLEERTVEIDIQQGMPVSGMMFPMGGGMEGMDMNITEMLQDMLPKRSKRRTVTVAEARRILFQEELDRLVDMDEVVNEALDRAEETGIIFLDELDKVAGGRGGAGPDVSR
ncbi:MAG: AAA domain-containing protein, partial [Gemmatimonadetes bacterium]|nr:AAA domain-containing protein [Gemmatimonadota bacterium]